MKVAVIGYSGAGKSTVAKQLADFYNCPVLHLDKVQFEENWKERDIQQAKEMVHQFMENSCWVIDGNYEKFYLERRLEEANQIIFLDFSRTTCLWRVYCRFRKYKNTTRGDMASGCKEKLDFDFLKWILIDGRTKQKKKIYAQIISKYPHKTIALKNQHQVNTFLYRLTQALG